MRRTKTFDELVSGYYGGGARHGHRHAHRHTHGPHARHDDGEVLASKPAVVDPDEYVVAVAAPAPAAVAAPAPPAPPAPAPAPVSAPAPAPVADTPPPAAVEVLPAPAEPAAQSLSEDELLADMKAILSGTKVYDEDQGAMVDRRAATPPREPAPEPPAPGGEQEIFDRISASMQYANAYDLGTVELENRFADFDRIADLGEGKPPRPPAPDAPSVGGADFLQDLDELRSGAVASGDAAVRRAIESMPRSYSSSMADWTSDPGRDAGCAPSALKLGLTDQYARPMYDSGEHAQAGGDLYPDQLHVGRGGGVAFSYGELVAMGDLYESADQMMGADPAELSRLKGLIDRNTQYYRSNKATPALDVTNDEWDTATGGRYLTLAEANYEHFAPDTLFGGAAVSHGDHKSAWQANHRRALEEAQRMALAPENRDRSYLPEWPLIVNAFGDHFLTDAFASGHLINKDAMIARFRANFFSGADLNADAEAFFGRLAEAAFVGEVRRRFSTLETAGYPVCFHGWCIRWHPNIDSPSMFRRLLVEAAKTEPERVANLAVKALHDRLNEDGVDVANAAGEHWRLTGDGFLNATSLRIMRAAVQQSVDNVNDPAIQASNLDVAPYLERVWRHTPQLTAASRTQVMRLVDEYTNPRSTVLSGAAAKIIQKQLDSLIKLLLSTGKLKPA